eukprot:PhF_6_TR5105/c0_g1_i1/m.7199
MVATLTAVFLMQVPPSSMTAVHMGYYSANAVLCSAIFSCGGFVPFSLYNVMFGLVASSASVFFLVGWSARMQPLPVLTVPFITATYIFILARKHGMKTKLQHDQHHHKSLM